MKEQATIEQMNEAIATFEGRKQTSLNEAGKVTKYWSDAQSINPFYSENVHYHESWEWLMPVVEKIQEPEFRKNGRIVRSTAQVVIYYKACIVTYEPDEESGDTNEDVKFQTKGETKLEAVYHAVYQFIQWYNSNKS